VRPLLAVLAGAAVGAIAAVVLGEYGFDRWVVIGEGLFVGLFVGEAMVAVARGGSAPLAAGAAVLAAGSLVWAGWISTGHRLGTVDWEGWTAVALAGAVGALRAWWPPAGARRSRPEPAATE
jgi:hypothetical protein